MKTVKHKAKERIAKATERKAKAKERKATAKERKHTKTHFKKKHCSPKKGKLLYSCFTKSSLYMISNALNQLPGISIDIQQDTPKLYKDITSIMKQQFQCNTEACWMSIRKFMKLLSPQQANLIRSHFRHAMPDDIVKDYTKWISNFDIIQFLKQYHDEMDDFYSYGAVPIDFKKCSVSQDLCKISIKQHKQRGESKVGIVFNTDESGKPGEHWICMFIDISGDNLEGQPGIYYFDSFGEPPEDEVVELIDKLQKETTDMFVVLNNDRQFQENTFSCGFYCMHFLEHMILGKSFDAYKRGKVNDSAMIRYRNHCFLHPDEIK